MSVFSPRLREHRRVREAEALSRAARNSTYETTDRLTIRGRQPKRLLVGHILSRFVAALLVPML